MRILTIFLSCIFLFSSVAIANETMTVEEALKIREIAEQTPRDGNADPVFISQVERAKELLKNIEDSYEGVTLLRKNKKCYQDDPWNVPCHMCRYNKTRHCKLALSLGGQRCYANLWSNKCP